MTKFIISTLCMFLVTFPSGATMCTEEVREVITTPAGGIIFKTNITCNWCSLGDNWTENAKKNGYAQLLTALTSGQHAAFDWPAPVENCTPYKGLNGVSPNFIVLPKP